MTTTTYSPEELEALGREHVPDHWGDCLTCSQDNLNGLVAYPCPTARLLATVRQERALRLADNAGEVLHKVMNEASAEYVTQQTQISSLKSTLEAKDAEIAELTEARDFAEKAHLEACAELEAHCETCPKVEDLREQLRQQTERVERLAQIQDTRRLMLGERDALRAENAALNAQVAGLQQEVGDFQASAMIDIGNDRGPCRVEPRHITEHVESLRSTIEAQEIEKWRAGAGAERALRIELAEKLTTKDAILRECAKTFREYERLHRGKAENMTSREKYSRVSDYMFSIEYLDRIAKAEANAALAAKCEAAIGEEPAQTSEVEHVCGLSGFGQRIHDECPACRRPKSGEGE